MISIRSALSFLLIGTVALGASAASAANYFVSPSGDDSNDGTSISEPWRTIAKANGVVAPGDQVFLRGGKYVNDPIRPGKSGTAASGIRYAAHADEEPVLTSSKVGGLDVAILLSDRSYITVAGIHVDGVKPNPAARVNHFVEIYNGSHNTIIDCEFRYATGWHGIRITEGAHHNNLINNVIDVVGIYDDGNGQDSGDSIQILRGAHHNLIQGNTITRGAHNLLQIDKAEYNVVTGNTFDNDWSEILGAGKGGRNLSLMGRFNLFEHNIVRNAAASTDTPTNAGMKTEGEGNIVRRNYIYGNSRDGIISQSRNGQKIARNNYIYHNTIYSNGGGAWNLTFYDGGDGVTRNVFKNNIVYGNRLDSSIDDADILFRLAANPTGVVGESIIEGNLMAKRSSGDAAVDIKSGGGVMNVADAERQYSKFFMNNISASPTFISSNPSKPEDFELSPGSRGIDEAAPLTRTRSAGSGTVLAVRDAGYFTDGFSLTSGDRIQIGAGAPVKVAKVDYEGNAITLSESREWSADAAVSLEHHGAAPDIGAYESGRDKSAPRRPKAPGALSGTVR